jgi:hypothetical protein
METEIGPEEKKHESLITVITLNNCVRSYRCTYLFTSYKARAVSSYCFLYKYALLFTPTDIVQCTLYKHLRKSYGSCVPLYILVRSENLAITEKKKGLLKFHYFTVDPVSP